MSCPSTTHIDRSAIQPSAAKPAVDERLLETECGNAMLKEKTSFFVHVIPNMQSKMEASDRSIAAVKALWIAVRLTP